MSIAINNIQKESRHSQNDVYAVTAVYYKPDWDYPVDFFYNPRGWKISGMARNGAHNHRSLFSFRYLLSLCFGNLTLTVISITSGETFPHCNWPRYQHKLLVSSITPFVMSEVTGDVSGSKFFDPHQVGLIFCCWPGSGQPSLVCIWVWKIPPNLFNFFLSWSKKSHWV